jgi:hypothetical protein
MTKISDAMPCCPVCDDLGGGLHVGKDNWGYCAAHNQCWLIGSGLFTDPDPRPEAWAANRETLRQFQCSEDDRRWLDKSYADAAHEMLKPLIDRVSKGENP